MPSTSAIFGCQPRAFIRLTSSSFCGVPSGLQDAERILKGVKGVTFNYFTSKDVVRHPLVGRIIEAYEADEAPKA